MVKLKLKISPLVDSVESITITNTSSSSSEYPIYTLTIDEDDKTVIITRTICSVTNSGDDTITQYKITVTITKNNVTTTYTCYTFSTKTTNTASSSSLTSNTYTILSFNYLLGKYITFDNISKRMYNLKFYKKNKFIWLKIHPKK